ncbi:MAG: neutral/alkaline non-lysosomal ceramidase N-terminal domain-containing protein [Verrucomicrobiae bacterium]|nr:neutral/alkaline non-lysosomal ceramidase N-terminal domain-containing protein [Verrucomicrobiae bacterium]
MKQIVFRFLPLMVVALLPFSISVESRADDVPLMGGVSQIDITPEVGYPHYRGVSTAIDDELYVKSVVLSQGEMKWAIAVCDLLWIERELSAEARIRVSEKTGIPFEHVLIAATHTHTGPAYHPNIYELNNHVRKASREQEREEIARDNYPDRLLDRIVASLVQAHDSVVPVTVRNGTARVDDLSFNRRFYLADGKVRTNPGVGNRSIVRAAGPIDPDLDVLWIERSDDGGLLGVVSSFAVHSDTYGSTAFSADYPGVLARNLEEALGDEVVSLFLQGASGDLNHVNTTKGAERLKTSVIGERLAREVLGIKEETTSVDDPTLDASSEFVYVPLQSYSEEELRWAMDLEAMPKYGESGLFQRRRPMKIRSLARMRAEEAVPPTVEAEPWVLPVEVQAFRLSDEIAVVGLPGEVFVELGLAIKEASPFPTTIVVELAQVHIAYVPTRKAFAEGGYETLNSRLAPGGGEMLVESAIQQLRALRRHKSNDQR